MPKIMVSLVQRRRLRGVCAAWRSIFFNKYERIFQSGYPERTSGIECGSGFQPRNLLSRLEAAPTESLSNGTWT